MVLQGCGEEVDDNCYRNCKDDNWLDVRDVMKE